ncbi:zinc finger CCCH domain-containing protein 32 [Canna indica]|uniref:Zinc finger CCCH domain-containing protein 32 n=1 Tax=Canna indica TaxID=4628 RepID=A0AAQ3Q1V1_9LILI|nr:zinc finger CCCH domain-containing protein 32 [Canna indica]
MESESGREVIQPVTAEDETLKRNTDCVYFLASPLTCKKGSECEYRHSEGARMNPRDCWYWLNGNCLNLKCSFRHPPLDSLFATSMPTSGPAAPPQNAASTRVPAARAPASNMNKQNVPCYYFQWGQCLKGERCSFMHGPQTSTSSVSQQVATSPTCITEPPQTNKKGLEQNIPTQHIVAELNKPKMAVETPPATAKVVTRSVNAPNNEPLENKILPPYSFNDEAPVLSHTNISASKGYSLTKSSSHQMQPVEEQPENSRETDEFLPEYSPGFDVLVENDVKDPDYFHNEDNFSRMSAHDGQNLEPDDDYGYHHSDYELLTKSERDPCNGAGKHENYDGPHGRYGWEPKMPSRIMEKPSSERRVLDSDRKHDDMDVSDLRHRLLKQRRFASSRSTEGRDGHGERYRRDDGYAEDRGYGRNLQNHRQFPLENSVSNRLQGRIAFPGRSSADTVSKFHAEKERGRRLRGRLSPTGQMNYQERRNPERLRQQPSEDFSKDARSIRNKPTKRDDTNSLDFAGPKSLAELKGTRITGSSPGQSIRSTITDAKLNKEKSLKVEGLQESEDSPSFEGPKPLSAILKRKRESANMDTEIAVHQYENDKGAGGSATKNPVMETTINVQPEHPIETGEGGHQKINNHETREHRAAEEDDVEEEEGMIPPDDQQTYDGPSPTKADEVENEDGLDLENVEDEELVDYEQKDEEFEYEASELKAQDGEATIRDDEDELDDEDDFAQKVSFMLS